MVRRATEHEIVLERETNVLSTKETSTQTSCPCGLSAAATAREQKN